MRNTEESKVWVVYRMTIHGKPTGMSAVCEQREWDAMERAQPGHHTLIMAGLTNEGKGLDAASRSLRSLIPDVGAEASTRRRHPGQATTAQSGKRDALADLEWLAVALGGQSGDEWPNVAGWLQPAGDGPQRVARLHDVDDVLRLGVAPRGLAREETVGPYHYGPQADGRHGHGQRGADATASVDPGLQAAAPGRRRDDDVGGGGRSSELGAPWPRPLGVIGVRDCRHGPKLHNCDSDC